MSYDISNQVQNTRSRAELRLQEKLEDEAREKFLHTLYTAKRAGKVTLTEYEDKFVEDWAAVPLSLKWWTPGRRNVADEMKRGYA